MARASVTTPKFTYFGSKRLPADVEGVLKEVQSLMMDDSSDRSQPGTIPNMPREFICFKVIDDKKKIMDLSGENKRQAKLPELYQVIVPFQMKHLRKKSLFLWCGNVISFSETSDVAVINIKGVVAKVKNYSTGQRDPKVFDISTDVKDIPSKPLRTFLQSPLVYKQDKDNCLISSHKMTITWLRSRLNKALDKYKEIEKDVEVIATIKQKDGGPLFLRLRVEKTTHRFSSRKITTFVFLFTICPGFRLTPCQLVVPMFSSLGHAIPQSLKSWDKHHLWKIVIKCDNTTREHEHKITKINQLLPDLSTSVKREEVQSGKPENDEKEAYKVSINKTRLMTASERRQCEQCLNPSSRMLLEYYYKYGHIPDDEMNRTVSYVWEILKFLKASIQEDRHRNDPKILDFVESGSVSEKLKVVQPDEFDVMIAIDLPESTQSYTFVRNESFPAGYAICKVRPSNSFSRGLKRCFKKSEEFGHCLAPEQLAFGWLYGKLERAINKYKEGKVTPKAKLKLRRGGPALLLEITPSPSSPMTMPKLPRMISVDLVLALKLSENDSRFAVAKRAKEEHFYKKVYRESLPSGSGDVRVPLENQRRELAPTRRNLKYLWRISYSAQEKKYLEHAREIQWRNGIVGCQDICLKILKTVCTREILKREQSVIYHKLSSYILKTALFHILARSNLVKDWGMNSLADRYVDLLNELSKFKELPHFFFNNASNLRKVFPEDHWCDERTGKNLMDELHATLKIQLLNRFVHIAKSFKDYKRRMDAKYKQFCEAASSFDYSTFLTTNLGVRDPEEVIHPPFDKSARPDEESKKSLVKDVAEDRRISKAAKTERKSGPRSDPGRNLERPEEDERKSKQRQKRQSVGIPALSWEPDYDWLDDRLSAMNVLPDLYLDEPDYSFVNDDDDYYHDEPDSPEFWDFWNDD